jgi:ABC-type iron transport system FetAB ATPase subunit
MPILATSLPDSVAVIVVFLLIAIVLTIVHRSRKQLRRKRQLVKLRANWGNADERDRDFVTLAEFHQVCPPLWNSANSPIDNQTWNDLNMDEIHGQMDRTLTSVGECLLYRLLRVAMAEKEPLETRIRLIQLFQEDSAVREAVQMALVPIGRQNARGLISLIWGSAPEPYGDAWQFRALTAAAVFALLLEVFVGGPGGALSLIAVFVINMSVHSRIRSRLMGRLGALRQLGTLVNAAERLSEFDYPELKTCTAPLQNAARAASTIARKVSSLIPEGSTSGDIFGIVLEYVSIFFLHEVRTFNSVLIYLRANLTSLRLIFSTVGELDALQAVASFRAGGISYCEPQFAEDGPRLAIHDARHPLLPEPVPNSIDIIDSGIAITGSNMSGKTTFLKTVAVNALLAQTIGTCLATSYRARFLRIISSINEQDDLLEGKSYYLAEAERLLAIVRQSEGAQPILALIDEPLAGTNSPERLAASREILRYLVGHGALVMVSTHDVEMVAQLQRQGQFQAFHFADQADDQGIRFDYRLRNGLDYHGNAIKVLKYLGYPDSIIDNAMSSLATAAPQGRVVAPRP